MKRLSSVLLIICVHNYISYLGWGYHVNKAREIKPYYGPKENKLCGSCKLAFVQDIYTDAEVYKNQ